MNVFIKDSITIDYDRFLSLSNEQLDEISNSFANIFCVDREKILILQSNYIDLRINPSKYSFSDFKILLYNRFYGSYDANRNYELFKNIIVFSEEKMNKINLSLELYLASKLEHIIVYNDISGLCCMKSKHYPAIEECEMSKFIKVFGLL